MSNRHLTNINLWQEQPMLASSSSTPASERSLKSNLEVDVAIVGAGVTGLSAALHLAEAGFSVALFEAREVAHRASGRNGGQIVPGLKVNPDALINRFGEEVALRMMRFSYESANTTFELIERYGIQCDALRSGWIQGAFSPGSSEHLRGRVKEINRYGGDTQYLDGDAMRELTGSSFWPGGLFEKTAGSVQPLSYCQGLADVARRQGASIYEFSPVESINLDGAKPCLSVNGYSVQAMHVVLATDAYTDKLWPSVTHSYVGVSSAQIATAPLSSELLAQLMPSRAGISETRKITYYCRISPDGRFVIGGRANSSDLLDESSRDRLRKAAVTRFPELEGQEWPYGWACRVGMTMDDLPRMHQLAPNVWTAYGYCGRGMAMGTALGTVLRDAIKGVNLDKLEFPVTPVTKMPFYPLRQLGAGIVINWYRMCDALGYPR